MSPEQFIARVRKQARKILAGTVHGSDTRIFPGYWTFELSDRPGWWRDESSRNDWGPVIGVHQVEESLREAIIVTERGLAVHRDPMNPIWLPYERIGGMQSLSKDPVSKSLILRTKDGTEVELPFPDGSAFAFVQFIGYVTQQVALLSAS